MPKRWCAPEEGNAVRGTAVHTNYNWDHGYSAQLKLRKLELGSTALARGERRTPLGRRELANLFPLPAIQGGLFVGCLTSGNQAQRSDWINSCIEASLSAVSRAGAFGCEVNGLLRSGAVGQDDGCQPHQAAIASRTLVSAACERMAGVLVFSEGRCDRDADIEAPACAAQK